MTGLALVVTLVTAATALALAFTGTYWLGLRNAYRAMARELLWHELSGVLADVEIDDVEDDDGGVGVLA